MILWSNTACFRHNISAIGREHAIEELAVQQLKLCSLSEFGKKGCFGGDAHPLMVGR